MVEGIRAPQSKHTRPLRWLAWVGVALAVPALSSCLASAYACSDSMSCEGATPGGRCEASGFCSFPDPACDSGRRYGEFAGGGLADTCVDEDPGSTGPGSSTSSSTSTTTFEPATTGGPSDESNGDETLDPQDTTTGAPACPDDWWDCDRPTRQRILLHPMALEQGLEQFPFPAHVDETLLRDPSLVVVDASGQAVSWQPDADLLWIATDVEPDTEVVLWAYAGNARGERTRSAPVWDPAFVGVWHLDDAKDVSGFGNTAEPEGVVFEPGYFGPAARFDGVDDLMSIAASPSLADLRDDGFVIEMRLLPNATVDAPRRLFEKADTTDANLGWSLLMNGVTPDNGLQLDRGFDLAEFQETTDDFDAADWVHISVTLDADDHATFWANGVLLDSSVQQAGMGTAVSDADQPATIGALTDDEGSSRYYAGLIDELRISRGARSTSWVLATYLSGLPDAVTVDDLEDL